jgi:hypothetical protein
LPSPYTSYAPAAPVITSPNNDLQWAISGNKLRVRGNQAFYQGAIDLTDGILNSGANCTAAPFTAVDLSSYIPSGAATANLEVDAELHNGAAQFIGGLVVRWNNLTCDNVNDLNLSLYAPVASFVVAQDVVVNFPLNADRKIYATYLFTSGSVSSTQTDFLIRGYSWAN